MSDVDSVSNHQPSAMPPANANPASWRQVFKRAIEQSSWISIWREHRSHSTGRPGFSMLSRFNRKHLTISLLFLVLGSLIAFGIIRYMTLPSVVKHMPSPVTTGKSLLGFNASAKPKPAPGKPFVPVTQTHLPIPTVWVPSPQDPQTPSYSAAPQTAQGQLPAPVLAPPAGASPALPMIPAKSSFAPLVYQARHDKHFGGSCSGQLTLNAAGLTFRCPDDPEGSLQVALNEIGAVDENGVQLLSGKKYHFSISGMNKGAEQAVFANWLHQVR